MKPLILNPYGTIRTVKISMALALCSPGANEPIHTFDSDRAKLNGVQLDPYYHSEEGRKSRALKRIKKVK